MTLSDQLRIAREWHTRYRELLPRRVADGQSTIAVQGDAVAAAEALVEACRLRAEAHLSDRKRIDPAWDDETVHVDHAAVLDFYVDQLTQARAPVRAVLVGVDAVIGKAIATRPVAVVPVVVPVDVPPVDVPPVVDPVVLP